VRKKRGAWGCVVKKKGVIDGGIPANGLRGTMRSQLSVNRRKKKKIDWEEIGEAKEQVGTSRPENMPPKKSAVVCQDHRPKKRNILKIPPIGGARIKTKDFPKGLEGKKLNQDFLNDLPTSCFQKQNYRKSVGNSKREIQGRGCCIRLG